MRVRIYEVGGPTNSDIHYLDQFPCTLAVDEQGCLSEVGEPVCELDDLGGEISYRALHQDRLSMLVNDAPLECGPLSPGDQLAVGTHRFMISYERTATQHLSEHRYRIME